MGMMWSGEGAIRWAARNNLIGLLIWIVALEHEQAWPAHL